MPGPNGYTIFTADYVDTVEGTGLVHQAPYGEDDMNTLNAKGIKSTDVLDDGCRFTAQCPDYEGDFVFDANLPILRNLRAGDGPLAEIPEELRALLPALLALRHPADLQAGLLLVRVRDQDQAASAGIEPADQLDPGQRQGRPVRQVARQRARLVHLPQPLLGFPDSGVGE